MIAWVGICSNDAERYPQDSTSGCGAPTLPYRYLHDPSGSRTGLRCAGYTQFFIFERGAADWTLRWHGTIDDSRATPAATTPCLQPAAVDLGR